MSTSTISDLYGLVRSALGDHGVYDDSDTLISGTYYWQNATIKAAITLVALDIDTYNISGTDYISPAFTNNEDKKFFIYSAALILLLPERDRSIRTPHFTLTKDDINKQIGYIWSQIENSRNNGYLPYAKDGSLQHLYNLSSRMSTQILDIQDPQAATVIPNGYIEIRDEDGNVALVKVDI
ncbi:MAG: hypothetical protein P1S60_07090 [Anaerolineae bacterium]|nr:hypothetical protein [Anaerolineae bacterium]